MKSTNTSTPMLVGALAIASIIGAAAFVLTQSNTGKQTTSQASATSQTTTQETSAQTSKAATSVGANTPDSTTTTNTASSGYKDGSYSASAVYSVPKGFSNDITVTVSVENGVIASVSSKHSYEDRESGDYVDWFDAAIDEYVVGKSLGDVSLSRVGGASLTTYGFEDALATIANQAKA
jgi:uncharacterized protein with FMN-binding domain